jgi:transcriptional regulator with GAF, ATPase, and Fis domain
MARELHSCVDDDHDALARIAGYAVSVIPDADYAGIAAVAGTCRIKTLAATNAFPRLLHVIQNRHGEGPDLHAAAIDEPVRVDDLASDVRWPAYNLTAVAQTPIRSSIAFQLSTGRQTLGVLHIYAAQPYSFDPDVDEIGMVFATHAALAWDSVRRGGQFRSALESRDSIGQAKGMIMERYHVDADGAFAMLRKMSQNSNVRLADIAREIIAMDVASAPQSSRMTSRPDAKTHSPIDTA